VSGVGHFDSAEARVRFGGVYEAGMRELPEPDEVHDVPTDYGRVRAYRFGTAPGTPVVLLHGRDGTTVSWAPNVAPLAARRSVYAVDLLGEAGRSEQAVPIRDAGDQAAWFAQLLDGLGLPPAHLVGVSIGGWAACNQAVRTPERVRSAALLDPVATVAPISVEAVLRTIPTILPFVDRWARERFLGWVEGSDDPDPQADPVGRVIDAAMEEFHGRLPQPAAFTEDELRGIRVPVLVLLGGRSVMHDAEQALRTAREQIPGVEAELWPEATHAVAGQCADEVNARLLRFFAEVDAGGSGDGRA
jgi:pimeloyl-ACP methyl ester carboxylesterase